MSEFSENVLNIVKQIPKGKVSTYSAIAEMLNCKAYRAVGQILKRNKNPDEIPCYRVVKSNGELGGYSASGGIKEKIKKLEKDGIKIENGKINLMLFMYKFK